VELLTASGNMDGPGGVAEVAAEFPEDGGLREGGEGDAVVRVIAFDGLEECEERYLREVGIRFTSTPKAPGVAFGKVAVVLNEAVAKVAVAAGAVAAKEALDAFIAFIAGAGPPRSASGRSFGRERVRWGEGARVRNALDGPWRRSALPPSTGAHPPINASTTHCPWPGERHSLYGLKQGASKARMVDGPFAGRPTSAPHDREAYRVERRREPWQQESVRRLETGERKLGEDAEQMARVVIIESDDAVRRLIVERFCREGHDVVAERAQLVITDLIAVVPDLVLAELTDSELDPLPLVRRHSSIPVVALLAAGGHPSEADVLDGGADDVLRKPLSLRELMARCRAVLRRTGTVLDLARLEFDGLIIDRGSRLVDVRGTGPVELPHREFDLLAHLAASPGQVFSREQLLQTVWDSSEEWQGTATVTEHVYRLRRRLGPVAQHCISTVRSVGYRFSPPNDVDSWPSRGSSTATMTPPRRSQR
jgi:two-component system, OmpR family, phosphate regulon response regulator PhoB